MTDWLNMQQDINWWTGVDYLCIIVMFLSAVWTLILTAPIQCRGSIGEQVMSNATFLQIFSDEQKKNHLILVWPKGEYIIF